MHPFKSIENIQDDYKSYVYTFQKFKNPVIQDWINDHLSESGLLWKEPFIQLNRRFEYGESLHYYVNNNILHNDILNIFTKRETGDLTGDPIIPYKHQTDSIKSILINRENTIVTTGTSSGKSFCFGIPIVSECLKMKEMGIEGVKAIIVYPMNALANSQYEDFAQRLHKSGLKIALYTGDTKNNHAAAVEVLRSTVGRDPYDSEVLSREEIHANPPDILMTNYVMLDLILTRFEDQKLFPEKQRGSVSFLVLDEFHTYSGKRGADVACLVRRLKERTNASENIRCIGTSATIQGHGNEDARSLVSQFASRLFGESFKSDFVIGETYLPIKEQKTIPPYKDILITKEILDDFDGSVKSGIRLYSSLLGKKIKDEGVANLELGELLSQLEIIKFLYERLSKDSLSLSEICSEYHKIYRKNFTVEEASLEIKAALLSGTIATINIYGSQQPLFILKIHNFFSQGRTITSCLTEFTPHLNEKGESTCTICARHGKNSFTFPLSFCRSCGQEYYGATLLEDNSLLPRDIEMIGTEGKNIYILKDNLEEEITYYPEEWMDNNSKLKHDKKLMVPSRVTYCKSCNKIDDNCQTLDKVDIIIVQFPFPFCPTCKVVHDTRTREFSKLFTFGSIGRSTGTDILVSAIINNLEKSSRKIIAFSDSRQDTSLQAAHMNNLQKRIHFRQSLYHTLIENNCIDDNDKSFDICDLGNKIFETMKKKNILPDYAKDHGKYVHHRREDVSFQRYLAFSAMVDIGQAVKKNQQNLEDVGLLNIYYEGLYELSKDVELWKNNKYMMNISSDERYDYLSGILDIFRKKLSISYKDLLNPDDFNAEVIMKIKEESLFDLGNINKRLTGFSDTLQSSSYVSVSRITNYSKSSLLVWTMKALKIDNKDLGKETLNHVISILSNDNYLPLLVEQQVKGYRNSILGTVLLLNSDYIRYKAITQSKHLVCRKCGSLSHRKKIMFCIKANCGMLSEEDFAYNNYFRNIYTRNLNENTRLQAEEHSGQLDGNTRKDIETRFRTPDDPLNVLICTPTMELGIDIGELSAIFMRNVPPSPSNYAQRAGRAGRKQQQSIITTFCGVGRSRGPHDQYFYRFPKKIISGNITIPRFMLNNKKLLASHIHSIVIQKIGIKFPTGFGEILDIKNPQEKFPLLNDFKENLNKIIKEKETIIFNSVRQAFSNESIEVDWLSDQYIYEAIHSFVKKFNETLEYWRKEYDLLLREYDDLSAQERNEKYFTHIRSRLGSIAHKLEEMRMGSEEYYSYRYLASRGFLPNYGFPSSSVTLSFYELRDEIMRPSHIALSEFAPGNILYYRGNEYKINYARPRRENRKPIVEPIIVCNFCSTVIVGEKAKISAACERCSHTLTESHPRNAMRVPDMLATKSVRITSDEEERRRLGYDITTHYQIGERNEVFNILGKDDKTFELRYEHNGKLVHLNQGTKKNEEEDGQESGFILCTACNKWIYGEDTINDHINPDKKRRTCPKNATDENILRKLILFTVGIHDVITIHIPLKESSLEIQKSFLITLKEALVRGIEITFNLDEGEISGFVTNMESDSDEMDIVIFETAEGGVGSLSNMINKNRFEQIIFTTLELLHGKDDIKGCPKACYECLLNFYNQKEHENYDRKIIMPFLEKLKEIAIEKGLNKKNDLILETLVKKCKSSFEKEVLHELFKNNTPLPDETQKIIYDGDRPIAEADFYYKDRNIVLLIDGEPHQYDYVSKGDLLKRRELKNLGYRVHSIHFSNAKEDLAKFIELLIN